MGMQSEIYNYGYNRENLMVLIANVLIIILLVFIRSDMYNAVVDLESWEWGFYSCCKLKTKKGSQPAIECLHNKRQ